jgi:hypothetical protein
MSEYNTFQLCALHPPIFVYICVQCMYTMLHPFHSKLSLTHYYVPLLPERPHILEQVSIAIGLKVEERW